MPSHELEMHQTVQFVGKSDVVYVISNSEEGKLGELRLSKGRVDWWPANSRTTFHACTWEKLRDFMESLPARS